MRKLLAVMPQATNYGSFYDLSIANSYEQAKDMIISAEYAGAPFDDLDLPVQNEEIFWEFIDWMEKTDRKYSFSIFGYKSDAQFLNIAKAVREKGFHFNS